MKQQQVSEDERICVFNEALYYADTHLRTVPLHLPLCPELVALQLLAAEPALEQLRHVHLIVSTRAGQGGAEAYAKNIVTPLLETFKVSFDAHYTTSATSHIEYSRVIHTDPLLIFLSGDTTISETVNALPTGLVPTLAVFPMGSANALYHSLGIVHPLRDLIFGTRRPLETFQVVRNGDAVTALVVFSWALHAALVSDAGELHEHGADKFRIAAQRNLDAPHTYRGTIQYTRAGKTHTLTESSYVLVTNRSNLEQNFVVSPASEPFSPHLQLVHLPPTSGNEIMRILKKGYEGGFTLEPEVFYEQVDSMTLRIDEADDRWRRICIDGTVHVPQGEEITVRKSNRRIQFLVS